MAPAELPEFTAEECESLSDTQRHRIQTDKTAWRTLPLFSGLPENVLERFSEVMAPRSYAAGEAILRQGDSGDDLFVLQTGSIRVIVRDNKDVVVFERIIHAPTVFGEMALVTNEPRSASIVAETEAGCLMVGKSSVKELFTRYPDTAVFLTRLVGERLMENQGIRKVGKYEVLGRLGSGGVATVFEALHPTLGTPVALKMLSHSLVYDEGFADHFAEEARLVAQLDHPHITRVIDTEQAYGTHFIVMEKLTGELLEEIVEKGPLSSFEKIRRILREVAEALAYSHDRGFVHRDVKPENVFLLTDGRTKLMDFGIATRTDNDGGEERIFGTPYYMSPEQILGRSLDGRSDLYSLGVMAYELITGDVPFDGDTIQELFQRHMREPLPPMQLLRSDVPEDLVEFVQRATQKAVKDRFEDCHQAAKFLRVAAEVPVLDRFVMSSLSVTYHESMKGVVEQALQQAVSQLEGHKGVVFFEAHRAGTATAPVRLRRDGQTAPPPPPIAPPPTAPPPTAGPPSTPPEAAGPDGAQVRAPTAVTRSDRKPSS